MDEKELAAQLRKPDGEIGLKVGEMMNKGNANFYHQLPNLLNGLNCSSVLEIGMGAGLHCQQVCEALNVKSYAGLDYSETMVTQATKNNSKLDVSTFFQANAASIPLHDNEFDLILTINTVYFFESLSAVFKEIHRVLKPGGKLVIGKRTKENLELLNAFTQYGFNKLSGKEVIDTALKQDFELIKETTYTEPVFEWNGDTVQLHSEFIVLEKR